MTSRRSRIKGIVNIPQRRKPENETIKEEGDQLSANYKGETEFEVNDSKITIAKNEPTKSISEDNRLSPHSLEENPDTIKVLIACRASTEQVESVEENVIKEQLPEAKAAPAANTPPTAFKRKFLKADANYEISNKSIDNYIKIDSSTTYAVRESFTECFFPQRTKETFTFSQPKKNAIHLEQTNKLAEARREFVRRFGFSKPERHRLTMMDLIVYNPETNPMVNEVDTKESDTVNDADDPTNNEENVDEPSNTNDTQSNEENEIPMPQIKIEPSGEITLDEQSLVIERKEVQRKREELEKSKVVDPDKIKTGYGIYKKNKCIKFWTSRETVYFYKALNTIGTDFTLMCELFPNRTRRELIIKFKKEEKINRNLIDKALMQPCKFDYEDLKNEIELEQRELEAIKKHQEEAKKFKEEISIKYSYGKNAKNRS